MNLDVNQIEELLNSGEITLSQSISLKLRIDNPTLGDNGSITKAPGSLHSQGGNELGLAELILETLDNNSGLDYEDLATAAKLSGYVFHKYVDEHSVEGIECSRVTSTLTTLFKENRVARTKGPKGRYVYSAI